ncbi:AraC family transcriptional regulator [Pseudomonas saudimassiliensis]|uniref:AraC family transcriptional regulator n=1 Tax=Pseudomonas saudimassiliensis TaxID=1461581 RepID=A0A078MHK6_9PSED|nr:AraC family transcriptional regulator [Pseudomonas saudimassiliensis]CEA04897.1 AraC family transcriptional regulator [Pseudomonas saudimassiliensis]CEF26852.1 AraC family transcriptional regulator [Pseudomonas saudimassiliensis]
MDSPRRSGWLECDTRFMAAHYQPASLIDLALGRGVNAHRLLQGTGLFHEDILAGNQRIAPRQFLRLIGNVQQQMPADDTSFLLGHQWLPGHYGAASHALAHAANLEEALHRLVQLQPLLLPLLRLRLRVDEEHLWLDWGDSFGAGAQRVFLIEAAMAAVAGMTRWLSAERLPWVFHLRHAQPRYSEQYWVHLGEQLRFASPLDQMSLPREFLYRPWPNASATAGQVAEREGLAMLAALPAPLSLLDHLHDHLRERIRHPLRLENTAEAFAMSPATLKRKLHKHGTGFQEQLDLARSSVALELYQSRGYSSEEVADYLNFTDRANFRRSLRRWTGLLPGELQRWLAGGQ